MQSNLNSHYDQMMNYQKALKEREKQEDAFQAERRMEENRQAMEDDRQRKRAKIDNYRQQQENFLKQKEEEKQMNVDGVDDFKRSQTQNFLKNKLKKEVVFLNKKMKKSSKI